MTNKITKTDLEWQQQLSDEQYRVTRKSATEPAFSGAYVDHNDKGTYHCICCKHPLFSSTDKFNSGCGWPSFSSQNEQGAITQHPDFTHGMNRTEVRCQQCDAHLGHVFEDGPAPSGLRYCINSVAIDFNDKE
ncbi:MAG: peptide-methionine (R)-S-oxide reductase [Methylophaga sp.]|nr:MAG: peptide-methionine (R)-S-oxide reductase [Methylophaga sp.]